MSSFSFKKFHKKITKIDKKWLYCKKPPDINVFGYLIPSLRKKKIQEANDFNEHKYMEWEEAKEKIEEENKKIMNSYKAELVKWKNEKNSHTKKALNLKENYFNKEPSAIIAYCEIVLSNSKYPSTFHREYDLTFI